MDEDGEGIRASLAQRAGSAISLLIGSIVGCLLILVGLVGIFGSKRAVGDVVFALCLITAGCVCLPPVTISLRRRVPALRSAVAPPAAALLLVLCGSMALVALGTSSGTTPRPEQPGKAATAPNRIEQLATGDPITGDQLEGAKSEAAAFEEEADGDELRSVGKGATTERAVTAALDLFDRVAIDQLGASAKRDSVPEMHRARIKLHASLAAAQARAFPSLRSGYAMHVIGPGSSVWENDIKATASGTANRVLTLEGLAFARNAEIAAIAAGFQERLQRLRFSTLRFRSTPYANGFTSYDLQPPSDAAVGTWEHGTFAELKKDVSPSK